jgi:hypothetical protein
VLSPVSRMVDEAGLALAQAGEKKKVQIIALPKGLWRTQGARGSTQVSWASKSFSHLCCCQQSIGKPLGSFLSFQLRRTSRSAISNYSSFTARRRITASPFSYITCRHFLFLSPPASNRMSACCNRSGSHDDSRNIKISLCGPESMSRSS